MIPPPYVDARIAMLRAAFGTRIFTTHQAAEVLGRPIEDVWHWFFHGDGLRDEVARVAMHNADWRVVTRNPEAVMAERAALQYRDILSQQETWSAAEFSAVAAIPYQSANFLLSLLVRYRKLDLPAHAERYHVQRRRKVLWRG